MDPIIPTLSGPRSKRTIAEKSFLKLISVWKKTTRQGKKARKYLNIFRTASKDETSRKVVKHLVNELVVCCLTHTHDTYHMNLDRLRGLKILETLLSYPVEEIEEEHVTYIVWADLSCLHHFYVRLKADYELMQWFRRRQARRSLKICDRLMSFLAPRHYNLVLDATITFLDEANLWTYETFCSNILYRLLRCSDDEGRYHSLIEILSLLENFTYTDVTISRQILEVFLQLAESVGWRWTDGRLLQKLVDMYVCSLTPEESHAFNYEPLEKGIETCLRTMCLCLPQEHLQFTIGCMLKEALREKFQDENLLYFGNLLEHMHHVYTKQGGHHPYCEFTMPPIINLIASKKLGYSKLGLRLLHAFFDRHDNKPMFENPRIFLRDCHYDIAVSNYWLEDKVSFQRYRQKLHRTVVDSMLLHGVEELEMKNIFIAIALIVVEIPCAYTAVAGVSFAMGLQRTASRVKETSLDYSNGIHASVVAIISLICYVHKAEVLYDYVDVIVQTRADMAPQLNPPIRRIYKYAQHHVLWNNPDLFFEECRTRYGLWQCFKRKRKGIKVQKTNLATLALPVFDIDM